VELALLEADIHAPTRPEDQQSTAVVHLRAVLSERVELVHCGTFIAGFTPPFLLTLAILPIPHTLFIETSLTFLTLL